MISRRHADLAAVAVFSFIFGVFSLLQTGPVRGVVGIAYAITIPGYSLLTAVIPHHTGMPMAAVSGGRRQLPIVLQLALSLALSLALLPLLGMAAASGPWHLTAKTALAFSIGTSVVSALIAWQRRSYVHTSETRTPESGAKIQPQKAIAAIIVTLLLTATIAAMLYSPRPTIPTTQVALLSTDGEIVTAPLQFAANESVEFTFALRNSEGAATDYRVELTVLSESGNNATLNSTLHLHAKNNEYVEYPVALAPLQLGSHRLLLDVYKGDDRASPYRQLSVLIDISVAGENPDL